MHLLDMLMLCVGLGGRGDHGGPRGHVGGVPMLGMPGRPADMDMRADHRGGLGGGGAAGGGDPRHPGGPRLAAPQVRVSPNTHSLHPTVRNFRVFQCANFHLCQPICCFPVQIKCF